MGNTSIFGVIIEQETSEWQLGPISDLKGTLNGTCEADYTQINGTFFGTKNICRKLLGEDSIGNCPKQSAAGTTVLGLGLSQVSKVNNQTLCFKRDSRYNYHKLAAMRSERCKEGTITCGNR
jgi:hypothetical protein